MNNVREIQRINERELDLAVEGAASWHDDYKDSAYIFVGNLDKRLTEGDVITIFSQFGEILDINLPRIPEGGLRNQQQENEGISKITSKEQNQQQQQSGKPGDRRGFGFLLFEDQRSTILAVDNLNGFELLGRTLRVDHVRDYKMPKRRNEEGEIEEPTGPSRNAAPIQKIEEEDKTDIEDDDLDMEDPMAKYIARSKSSNSKEDDKEERKRRKEERRRKREEREQRRKDREYSHDRRDERERNDRHGHSSREKERDRRDYRREDERRSDRDRERSPRRSYTSEKDSRNMSDSYSKRHSDRDRR